MARSTVQNGSINRDNLILNLDASNKGSYPGTGNIWFDISGYGNHFTLQNNPVHDGTKLTFNQNGGNQYTQCINTTCGNFGSGSFTIEMCYTYISASNTSPYPALIMKRPRLTNMQWGEVGYHWNPLGSIYAGDGQGAASTSALFTLLGNATINAPTPVKNTIVHQTLTFSRNGLDVTGSLYTNGNLYGDNIQYTYTNGGNINNNIAIRLILSYGEGVYMTGSLYYVRMYDKNLTRGEIQQSYILARSKYGF